MENTIQKDILVYFFNQNHTGIIENRTEMPLSMGTEIYIWFLHLQENGKLPGIYERFTGKYIPINK